MINWKNDVIRRGYCCPRCNVIVRRPNETPCNVLVSNHGAVDCGICERNVGQIVEGISIAVD